MIFVRYEFFCSCTRPIVAVSSGPVFKVTVSGARFLDEDTSKTNTDGTLEFCWTSIVLNDLVNVTDIPAITQPIVCG